MTLITCTGYGGTGSSVVSDLFKEYNKVKSTGDFEFSLAHEVDGISDLQHHIVDDFNRLKTTEGLYRFKKLTESVSKHYSPFFNGRFDEIIDKYLNSLTGVKWQGFWHQHIRRAPLLTRYLTYIIPNIVMGIIGKYIHDNKGYESRIWMRRKEMILSYGADNFFKVTQSMFDDLTNELVKGEDDRYLVMDQLVPPYSTQRYINYFSNIKIIVIDRDPRDLYLLNKLFWNEGWIPSNDIDAFIKWFGLIREHRKFEKDNEEKVLRIQFEDLVLDYENAIDRIEKFIGIDSADHVRPRTFFNPDFSIRNMRLWEKYAVNQEDIKKIEENLSEYCYYQNGL